MENITRTIKLRTEICPFYLMILGSLFNVSKEISLVLRKLDLSGRWNSRDEK